MPTSSPMIITMLGGFFVVVCANAPPPNTRGSARIAVAIKLLLFIDVSFQVPNLHAGQRTNVLFHPARSGPTGRRYASKKKHPLDQRRNETRRECCRSRTDQLVRKFGEPPKIRRFLLCQTRHRQRRAFVTPLIYWTFRTERAAPSVLARFLRGDV